MGVDFLSKPLRSHTGILAWPLSRRQAMGWGGAALLSLFSAVRAGAEAKDVVDRYPWLLPWVLQDGFDRRWLEQLFGSIKPINSVLKAMDSQAEALPYPVYRQRLLSRTLIRDGLSRMKKHRSVLERIERELHVNGEVVVALWGIESSFGRNQGKYPVLNTLFTLAAGFARREQFFQEELRQFLLLCREESWDPRGILGSYAGAMGQVQMMPSSLRCFAVDFDGDGRRDVFNHTVDALGSIANYLRAHGWRQDGLFVVPVVPDDRLAEMASLSIDDTAPWHWWRDAGILLNEPVTPDADEPAALLALEGESGMEFVMCFNNFRVVTDWNRSRRFAMVVAELCQRLKRGS